MPSRAQAVPPWSTDTRPSPLEVVGITGTNGKTTTAHLVQPCIEQCGGQAGIVGTLGYRFGDIDVHASHTSPEADELARVASAMVARGATHLVMEVSSIALAAKRVDAVRFRIAVFTNLTQDHLDYHGTMEAYARGEGAPVRRISAPAPRSSTSTIPSGGGSSRCSRRAGSRARPRRRSRATRRRWARPGRGGDRARRARAQRERHVHPRPHARRRGHHPLPPARRAQRVEPARRPRRGLPARVRRR